MNSKMTANSQLSTTGTGMESQKWRSHGLPVGSGQGKNGGKVQEIRSINGRYKIQGG